MHLKLESLPMSSHQVTCKNVPQFHHFHGIVSKTFLHVSQGLMLQESGKEIRNYSLIFPTLAK